MSAVAFTKGVDIASTIRLLSTTSLVLLVSENEQTLRRLVPAPSLDELFNLAGAVERSNALTDHRQRITRVIAAAADELDRRVPK